MTEFSTYVQQAFLDEIEREPRLSHERAMKRAEESALVAARFGRCTPPPRDWHDD